MAAIQTAVGSAPTSDDRREWTRFDLRAPDTVLFMAGGKHSATILNESFGGASLLVDGSPTVHVGDQVIVAYYGAPLAGVVKRVVSSDTGQALVGVQWPDGQKSHRATREKALFVAFSGFDIACRIVRKRENAVIVRLPDGTRIETSPQDVAMKTRAHRRAELDRNEADVYLLTAIYHLGTVSSKAAAMERILAIEFASSWK